MAKPDANHDAAAREPSGDPEAAVFLRRWLGLSAVQRRALEALINEIAIASGDVESNVQGLSRRLQSIAGTAREQAATVQDLVGSVRKGLVGKTARLRVESAQPGLTLAQDGEPFDGHGTFTVEKPRTRLLVHARHDPGG